MKDPDEITPSPPQPLQKGKGVKTDRQKRLGSALRENLRKRKAQKIERQKSSSDPMP